MTVDDAIECIVMCEELPPEADEELVRAPSELLLAYRDASTDERVRETLEHYLSRHA